MENLDQRTHLTNRETDLLSYWKTLVKDANTKRQTERWLKLFRDKETRYGYIDSFLDSYLGMQIRVLREQRGWNQTELGEKCDMQQTRISLLESMNYSAWSVDVLRRLAKAFNLRLVVKFEDFGSFTREYFEDFDRENLKRNSFEDDVIFGKKSKEISKTKKVPSEPSKEIIGKMLDSFDNTTIQTIALAEASTTTFNTQFEDKTPYKRISGSENNIEMFELIGN